MKLKSFFSKQESQKVTGVTIQLGCIEYDQAYRIQKQYVQKVFNKDPNTLIICEHPATITMGRMTDPQHIFVSEDDLLMKGIVLRKVDRGGDVTLHAPGQIVIYPIFDLATFGKDLKKYLRCLEQVVIDFLAEFDILAERNPGNTGVWVDGKKIASIGIGVKKWVTYHGISININTDLNLYQYIKPCGLDVGMTSLEKIKGKQYNLDSMNELIKNCFSKVFKLKFV